jgi:hypothetical protein
LVIRHCITTPNGPPPSYQALYSNTTGYDDTALGVLALYSNTTGIDNTAIGKWTLYRNTAARRTLPSARRRSIITQPAPATPPTVRVRYNTTGSNNIEGNGAGFNLTTGDNNIDIGNTGVAGE